MTKIIEAGIKEFTEAKEMVRRTDADVRSIEKNMDNETVKSNLSAADKRMFAGADADCDLFMNIFQNVMFAGLGGMIDIPGLGEIANDAGFGAFGQVAEELVLQQSDDAREEYLKQHKAEILERENEYYQERELEMRAKRKNEDNKAAILMLIALMMLSFQNWANENTVDEDLDADNDNETPENQENNVVYLFGDNKEAVRKAVAQPVLKVRNENSLKLALGM